MDETREKLKLQMKKFHLPRYHEIPDVGLFLEQTVRLINTYFEDLEGFELTNSMVSNYVKHKIIMPPIKKQYQREQIAYLVFMAVAKSILSLEDIRKYISVQKEHYTIDIAYDYFCEEFENILLYVFGDKDELEQVGTTNSSVKGVLRNMIFALAHKIYFDHYVEEVLK